jgi:hypothetical protein
MNNLAASTHSTSLDKNVGSASTVVREAKALTWKVTTDTWCAIPFDRPHMYDGKSDLVVEVRYIGGSGGGSVKRDGVAPRYYKYGAGAYSAPTGSYGSLAAFRVRLTHADLTPAPPNPSINTTVKLSFDSFPDAGEAYAVASAFFPAAYVVENWPLGLEFDPLFFLTVHNLIPSICRDYRGTLDAAGRGTAEVDIPNLTVLIGIPVYSAFAATDKTGLTVISDTGLFKIDK